MRFRRYVTLPALAAGVTAAVSCADGDSSLSPFREAALVGVGAEDAFRIVEPVDGRAVHAGQAFRVTIAHELHAPPRQGRGWLECSRDGLIWWRLGGAFPWTSEPPEHRLLATLDETGGFLLRARVEGSGVPAALLESASVRIQVRPHPPRLRGPLLAAVKAGRQRRRPLP